MAAVFKQDSNTTETRISEETSFKVANGSAVWEAIEPNSFGEARATYTKVARAPIFADRQRKKGTLTDLDATFGFNSDLTQHNHEFMLEGLMRARYHEQTEIPGALTTTANTVTFASGGTALVDGDLAVLRGSENNDGVLLHVTASDGTSVTVTETLAVETLPTGTKLVKVGVRAGAGDIEIDATGALPLLVSTVLDFEVDLNIQPGMFLWIGGDVAGTVFPTNATNNALVRVRRVIDANNVELDKASKAALVTEAPGAATIELFVGRLVKNETGELIVHPSYQIERQLGAPDDAQPDEPQSEYYTGCVYQKATLNYNPADKIMIDSTFLAADHEVFTGTEGLKDGTRPVIEADDGQNTTSDLKRINLSIVTQGVEAPTPLVTFIERLSIDIDNGDTPLKALTVLGAFQHSPADFVVTGTMDAYFASIAVIDAVRNNVTCTLDMMNFKSNAGWVLDLPLITLNDGGLNVEKDNPIKVPIGFDAASGEEVNSNLDYTAAFTFFDFLPTLAATPSP